MGDCSTHIQWNGIHFMKKKGVLSLLVWMSLEDTISQIQKNKYHMISHVKYRQLGLIEVGCRIVQQSLKEGKMGKGKIQLKIQFQLNRKNKIPFREQTIRHNALSISHIFRWGLTVQPWWLAQNYLHIPSQHQTYSDLLLSASGEFWSKGLCYHSPKILVSEVTDYLAGFKLSAM